MSGFAIRRVNFDALIAFFSGYRWTQKSCELADVLYFESPENVRDDAGNRIVMKVPASEALADYNKQVDSTVRALGVIYNRPADEVAGRIIDELQLRSCISLILSEGDKEAKEQFFQATLNTMRRAIALIIRDPGQLQQEQEDLVHDTFIRVLGSLPRLDGKRPVRPWISVIAKRVAIDWWRKRQSRAATIDPADVELPVQDCLDELYWSEFEAAFVRCFAGQEHVDELASVVRLKYVDDEKVVETVRLNITYACAIVSCQPSATHASLQSLDELQAFYPAHSEIIGDIFEAMQASSDLFRDVKTYEQALEVAWRMLGQETLPLPGQSHWRKKLLRGVGATVGAKDPDLDLSGSLNEIAGRERRRIDAFLKTAHDSIHNNFSMECGEGQ